MSFIATWVYELHTSFPETEWKANFTLPNSPSPIVLDSRYGPKAVLLFDSVGIEILKVK
jgi:hypothetical protein